VEIDLGTKPLPQVCKDIIRKDFEDIAPKNVFLKVNAFNLV